MTARKYPTNAGGMLAPVTSRHPDGTPPRTGGFRPYTPSPAMVAVRDRALVDQKATLLSLDARQVAPKDAK